MKSKTGKKHRQFLQYALMAVIMIGLMFGFEQSASAANDVMYAPSKGDNGELLFANGTPIIIVAGETEGHSSVYVDKGTSGEYDSQDELVTLNGGLILEDYDLSTWDIYGGSYDKAVTSTRITMIGGKVEYIYGGGYSGSATVHENTNITVSDGLVTYDVYGGGLSAEVHDSTIVNISHTAQIGTKGTSGRVYGGGSSGGVKGNTTVNITGGTIYSYVYGGGDGSGASVAGTATVNVGDVDGDSNQSIELINNVYGGGKNGTTTNAVVNINGNNNITAKEIYGGGQGYKDSSDNTISPEEGKTDAAEVNIRNFNSTINTIGNIFGGGFNGTTTNTQVTIDNSNVDSVYADGGEAVGAPTKSATVDIINNSTVGKVYGGREEEGNTVETNVNIDNSTVTTVFGSGYSETTRVTGMANINISNYSLIDAVYGGGVSGSSANSNITISDSRVVNVRGDNFNPPSEDHGIIILASGPANVTLSGTTNISNLYLENLINNQFSIDNNSSLTNGSSITLVLPEGMVGTIPVATIAADTDFAALKLAEQHLGLFELERDVYEPLKVLAIKLPTPPKPDRSDGSIGSSGGVGNVETDIETDIDIDTDTAANEEIIGSTVSTDLTTSTQDGITEGTAPEDLLQSMVSEALDDFTSQQAEAGQAESSATKPLLDIIVELPSDAAADTVNFTFDPAELQNDSEEAELRLVVQTELGTVAMNQTALEAIAQQAISSVTLSITQVAASELSDEQKAQIGDRPVYSLTLYAGDEIISDFDGGLITVTLPYTLRDGETAESIIVFFLDDDGIITAMETVYDAETQTVSFITGHFSYYFIGTTATLPTGYLYSDVGPDDWYYAAVQFAQDKGLLEGLFDTSFYPTTEASRALMVTLLYRLDLSSLGENSDTEQLPITFADVASDAYYAQAVAWAAANGIVNGYDADTFAPDDTLTREQMAAVLYRYAEYKGQDTTANASLADFSDADLVSDYAQISLQWAVGAELIQGKGQGILDPQGITTNAEVVTLLERIM